MANPKAVPAPMVAPTTRAKGRVPFEDRMAGVLWGLHIADALAMPAHWFYGGSLQVQLFFDGPIKDYVKPPLHFGSSIMNKSNTGGAGRGSDESDIIGTVINHGKKKFWEADKAHHYHCTLRPGENTLETQLVRLVYRSIGENGGSFSADDLRERYVNFMTTPGSHNDCYASTCHRMFFANRKQGRPLANCPDNDDHNVDTLDGLAMAIPVALATSREDADKAGSEIADCIEVTRKSEECGWYSRLVSDMLRRLLKGDALGAVIKDAAELTKSHISHDDWRWVRQMKWFEFNEAAWAKADPANS